MSSPTAKLASPSPTRTRSSDFVRALRAELLRCRHSASARIPLVGLLMCVVQGASWWTVSTQDLATWHQLFGWQALWATGIAAPITALVVGLAVQREQRAREGGTLWRATHPSTIQLARSLVLAGQLLLLQLLVTVPIIVFGWAKGLTGAPVLTMVSLALVLWAGNLPWAALAGFLSRAASLWVAVGAGLIWQVAGTLQAENPSWVLLPWTWSVRPALPLLGIHANGVRLEHDSPIWEYSIGTPAVVALAVGIGALLTMALRAQRERPLGPRSVSRRWLGRGMMAHERAALRVQGWYERSCRHCARPRLVGL